MSKKILVTGANGNIGGITVPLLLKANATVHVYVRDANKAENLAKMGAVVFEGDFSNQEALNQAAEGVDAVLAITPPGPDAVIQGEAILKAAMNSGSPYYVRLSAIGAATDAPTENGRLHYESDQAVINSGLSYTILRPHFFMQNIFANMETINTEGNMYLGMGNGRLGMIDVRDIADCLASLLLKGGHDNSIYTPTGSESIDFTEAARIISNSIGKSVNYVPVPVEAVGEAILKAGWGEWGAEVMMDYSRAYSEGWGDFTNNDVETITGQKARGFEQFVNEVLSTGLRQSA